MGDGIIVVFFWTGELLEDFRGKNRRGRRLESHFFYHKGHKGGAQRTRSVDVLCGYFVLFVVKKNFLLIREA